MATLFVAVSTATFQLTNTATSMMKNSGVSSAIVEEFVGHDSKEMNRVYTHIDFQTLKKAAEGLPEFG